VTFTKNHAYATTNNAASLAAARRPIGNNGFVLCDGDVIFSANPVPALLAVSEPCALAVDPQAPFDAEAMKVELAGDGAVTTISKHISPAKSGGESVGLQKVCGPAVPLLWEAVDRLVARAAATAYYEDAFQEMIDRGVRFGVSRIEPGSCIEIDDAADLAAARQRFSAVPRTARP